MSAVHFERCRIVMASFALLMTACQSAPTRVFMLEAAAPSSVVAAYDGPPIRVDAVHVPPTMDRIEILTDVGNGEFEIHELDHWSAPVAQLARQTLTADLAARLPPGRVIFPHIAKTTGAIGIRVDILAFSAGKSGARLQASWVLTSSNPHQESIASPVLLEAPNSGTAGAAATAHALGVLLAQLAERISADLVSSAPPSPR